MVPVRVLRGTAGGSEKALLDSGSYFREIGASLRRQVGLFWIALAASVPFCNPLSPMPPHGRHETLVSRARPWPGCFPGAKVSLQTCSTIPFVLEPHAAFWRVCHCRVKSSTAFVPFAPTSHP